MHDHDLDLIASLADGSIEQPAAATARDLIASCAECAREYETQTSVLGVLTEVAPARLTELERSRLRRAVHAEVDQRRTAGPKLARRWLTWVPAAAAAVVAIGFVGILGLGGLLSGGDDAADTAAGDAVQTEAMEMAREPLGDDGTSADADSVAAAPAGALEEGVAVAELGSVNADQLAQIVDIIVGDGAELASERVTSNDFFGTFSYGSLLECSDIATSLLGGRPTFAGRGDLDGSAPVEIFGFANEYVVLATDGCTRLQTSLR